MNILCNGDQMRNKIIQKIYPSQDNRLISLDFNLCGTIEKAIKKSHYGSLNILLEYILTEAR